MNNTKQQLRNQRARERYANDPEYRKRVKQLNREKRKLRYVLNPEFKEQEITRLNQYRDSPAGKARQKIYKRNSILKQLQDKFNG